MVDKISTTVTFPGAKLELRNSFDYPERDPNGNPTGRTKKARGGLFLHVAGGSTVDLSDIDIDELCKAHKELASRPIAKEIVAGLTR